VTLHVKINFNYSKTDILTTSLMELLPSGRSLPKHSCGD